MNFKKKLGPLPVWAWGLIGGVLLYFLYERGKHATGTAGAVSPTGSVFDPNALDPTTGLTYGQEYGLGTPSVSGAGGATGGGDNTGGPNWDQFDTQLMSFLQAQSDFANLAAALGYVPGSSTSDTTQTAAGSEPMKHKATKPHTKHRHNHKHPKVHTKPRPDDGRHDHDHDHHEHHDTPSPTPGHDRGHGPHPRHRAPPKQHRHKHPGRNH